MASERETQSPVAPAWRIPFRDAYVAAPPYLSGLPLDIQRALQDAAVLSSHIRSLAGCRNARVATTPEQPAPATCWQANHDRLITMAPNVGERYLRAAYELRGYLTASAAYVAPDDAGTA